MLTLKEPIKLNIADGLTAAASDSFYERINGNYSMLTAAITPKELLFYLSAPPELPEDLGGMTTFAIENNVTDNRAITMDIVNNVVNRIILSQTNDFTYQDQIYIDSVLRKLGVTDVSLFMKQVQKLTSEQTDFHQLLQLYKQETLLRAAAPLPEERSSAAADTTGTGREALPAPDTRYYLHSDIYSRLETKSIYDIVNAFQQEQSHYFGTLQKNELRTSEQLFVSNLLSLTELRNSSLQSSHLALTHAVNHFELGDLLPAPETEEQVLSQAAAAALVSTVEHVLVQKLTRQGDRALWLSLENSLSETIENTVSRFQSYHSGDAVYLTPEADISIETNNLYKTESTQLKKLVSLRQEYSEAARESAALFEALGALPLPLAQTPAEGEAAQIIEENSYISSESTRHVTEGDTIISTPPAAAPPSATELLRAALSQPSAAAEAAFPAKSPEQLQLEHNLREHNELLRETITREAGTPAPEGAEPAAQKSADTQRGELAESVLHYTSPAQPPQEGSTFISAEITNIEARPAETVFEQEQAGRADTGAPVSEAPAAGDKNYYKTESTASFTAGDTIINPPAKAAGAALPAGLDAALPQAQAPSQAQPLKTSKELRLEYDLREQSELLRETVTSVANAPARDESAPEAPERKSADVQSAELIEAIAGRAAAATLVPGAQSTYLSTAEITNVENSYSLPSSQEEQQRRISEAEQQAPAAPAPAEMSHPVSDSQASPGLIAQQVDEINRRNRERYQQVQGLRIEKTAQSIPTPDVQRTMSDALRSLEAPETVIREVLGTAPAETAHPQPPLPPEAQAYLSGADEATRSLLETVMRIEANPASAQDAAAIRGASPGELNAVGTVHPQAQTQESAAALQSLRETVKLTERADTVLEQYSEAPVKHIVSQTPASPMPRAAIVHRREQNTFSEELLERLEQQRSTENVTTTVSDNITNRESHELIQNEVTSKVVTQSTEDITQLVNRAISKQMGTISDKVYHQMEKRLQTERSRRGRI